MAHGCCHRTRKRIGGVLACVRAMLTPNLAQALPRWVCWVTAAPFVVCLVQSTRVTSDRPKPAVPPAPRSWWAASRAVPPKAMPPKAPASRASILFVAGPTPAVRFRVDLRDGTVSTPRAQRVLDRVIDVAVSERAMFLCQAAVPGSKAPRIVGFDLRTGQRTEAALAPAPAPIADPHFCAGHLSETARAQETWNSAIPHYSKDLQISLERQATILPRVSNGEPQSSFLISSRHSSSSLVTMPPGQS